MVEVSLRRLALCDEEPKNFENGAIQLAPMAVPITFLFFSIASAFAPDWNRGRYFPM